MHETGLARDVVKQANRVANGEPVRAVHLEVGALSGIAPEHLRQTIEREASQRWASVPRVEVTLVDDPLAPGTTGVRLTKVVV